MDVYRSLGTVRQIRAEVIKKLLSILKTNPFPRVRIAAAETLWVLTGTADLLNMDWGRTKDEVSKSLRDVEFALAREA